MCRLLLYITFCATAHVQNILEPTPPKSGILASLRFLERVPQVPQMWRYLWRFKQGNMILPHTSHVQNLLEAAPKKSVLLCEVRFLERVPQVPQMWCIGQHDEIFLNIPVASAELDENRFRLATCLASNQKRGAAHVQNILEPTPPKSVLLCVVRFLERVPQVPQMWHACAEPSRSHPLKKWYTLCSKILERVPQVPQMQRYLCHFKHRNLSLGCRVVSICFNCNKCPRLRSLYQFDASARHSAHAQNLLEPTPPKSDLLSSVRFLESVPQVPQVPQMWRYLWRFK